MSRVGKNPVQIPSGVTVDVKDGVVKAKGKLGELSYAYDVEAVDAKVEENLVWVKPLSETRKSRAMWGTVRSRVQNLVTGVSEGFTKKLEIVGVGYRAKVQGKTVQLALGFSHDVNYELPEGVTAKCATPTQIEITGADKQVVGQVASEIRAYRSPEPYKGKGVRYEGEYILRKEGKKK
jgi:large subunit ribosomal protein L6